MAKGFLELVAEHVYKNHKDKVEELCIVLPSRRASIFLKQHLGKAFGQTFWLPRIISAEDLVEELSGLKTLEEIDLICHLYDCYREHHGADAETFESFARWGQLILHDFNEIDRYMADAPGLYENLKDIKVIENWSLAAESLSEHQSRYLQFMSSIGAIYRSFTTRLMQNGWAYQGLAYRQAAIRCAETPSLPYHRILFCGFNALNESEIRIIKALQKEKKAELLWDADTYYLENTDQEAGHFLRKNFQHFGDSEVDFIGSHFRQAKEIRIISVPKQMGQAQVLKQALQSLIDRGVAMDKVAVVLANERLLWPVLKQLPPSVEAVNITMEYPLKYSASYSIAELLLKIQADFAKQRKKHPAIYHKDLTALLRQPLFERFAGAAGASIDSENIVTTINDNNIAFVDRRALERLLGEGLDPLEPFLQPCPSVSNWCRRLKNVFEKLAEALLERTAEKENRLEGEYIFVLVKNLNRTIELLEKYPHFNEYSAFRQLFMQVVGNSSAPFLGEPLRGLQIMGVLETRALDFDQVILLNVNEGILPSGKGSNSFIPNDLKKAFGLPLYQEKDAVYAYHFYRLLQRAHDITITFDSETDTFGKGERSRFITQLQLEMEHYNDQIRITEMVADFPEFTDNKPGTLSVKKTPAIVAEILAKATSIDQFGGLSPSGLITFRECPLRFYFRYGLRLKEPRAVEESAEAGTFGTILHLCLENLYGPFVGKELTANNYLELKQLVGAEAEKSFKTFFDNAEPAGKNLLQLEVIKVYVHKLLEAERNMLTSTKSSLFIHALEKEFAGSITVDLGTTSEKVLIRGKIDRIDRYGKVTRVIDYKSSIKESDKFVFDGFEKLFHDKNYNKQFQLFTYAWLLYKNGFEAGELQPCIIAFKSFSPEPRGILTSGKNALIFTKVLLEEFERELRGYVATIIHSEGSFEQTADADNCLYCSYKSICNIPD